MKKVTHSLKVTTLFISAVLVVLSGATAHARDTLNPGEMLRRGEHLTSENGQYRLVMQKDGNLVLYGAGKHPLWASNTQDQRVDKCIMQKDGNLVLYLHDGQPVWASNTNGRPGSYLLLQNDGNLVIYHPQPVWASNTDRGRWEEQHHQGDGPHDKWDHDRDKDRWRD
jgi:hypothetical protein